MILNQIIICIENFIYITKGETRWSHSFSLDHYPPENVGGNNTILVCKSCNSKAGHNYEASLLEMIKWEMFVRKIPSSEIKTTSVLDNIKGWHHSALFLDEEGKINFRLTSKDQKVRFAEGMPWENGTYQDLEDWKMDVTLKDIDKLKVSKSLVKAAYLYCFDYWGYDFIFSEGAKMMREVLEGEREYPIKIPNLWFYNKIPESKSLIVPTGLVFISNPFEYQAMCVNIPLVIEDYKTIVTIQIPNPFDQDFLEMISIQKDLDSLNGLSISMAPIIYQFNMAFRKPYEETWNELRKQYPKS